MRNITGIFLLLLILFQSCTVTVYHKTSVSIEEATNQGKVKVFNSMGQKYIYKNIVLKDSIYYGIIHGNAVTELRTYEPVEIYLKDKKKSKITSILVTGGTLVASVILLGVWAAINIGKA